MERTQEFFFLVACREQTAVLRRGRQHEEARDDAIGARFCATLQEVRIGSGGGLCLTAEGLESVRPGRGGGGAVLYWPEVEVPVPGEQQYLTLTHRFPSLRCRRNAGGLDLSASARSIDRDSSGRPRMGSARPRRGASSGP